jgi:hypothetical protein
MLPIALAFSLFLADQPAAAEAEPASAPAAEAPAGPPLPQGAPSEDYPFVAWCYGVLAGYLDLHDEVMPEVRRIEAEFRRPGSKLADDLKVYDDQQKQGRADLKRFRAALTAAEKASLKPINTVGAAALQRGHAVWNHGPETTKARVAQEWMSWTLPKRCTVTADALEKRARLMGTSFEVNAEPEAAPSAAASATDAVPPPAEQSPPAEPPALPAPETAAPETARPPS